MCFTCHTRILDIIISGLPFYAVYVDQRVTLVPAYNTAGHFLRRPHIFCELLAAQPALVHECRARERRARERRACSRTSCSRTSCSRTSWLPFSLRHQPTQRRKGYISRSRIHPTRHRGTLHTNHAGCLRPLPPPQQSGRAISPSTVQRYNRLFQKPFQRYCTDCSAVQRRASQGSEDNQTEGVKGST